MGTTGFGQHSDRGTKRIALIVAGALAVAVFSVAGAYWSRRAYKEVAVPHPQKLPSNVNQQLSGFTYTRSEGRRRIFTVHAARNVAFNQGSPTILEDVYVEVYGATGLRHDVMRTERCEYNSTSGELFAAGKVNIQLNNPGTVLPDIGLAPAQGKKSPPLRVYLDTSKVSLKEQGTILETSERVTFRTDRASGTAQGMTYATRTGTLELRNDLDLKFEGRGGVRVVPDARLRASRLEFDNDKKIINLSGPVEVTQGTRSVNAGRGTILLAEHHRVQQAMLEYGFRGADKTAGNLVDIGAQSIRGNFVATSGELQNLLADGNVHGKVTRGGRTSNLLAQQLGLAFSGVHPQPRTGMASGNVRLSAESLPESLRNAGQAAGKDSMGRQELSAPKVEFTFRPKQQSVEEAHTVGMGHLVLTPANSQAGQREIFGHPLMMDFDKRGRLESLQSLSRSRTISQAPKKAMPGALPDETSSDTLRARFDPATAALITLEQAGGFEFREGARRSTAGRALYESRDQSLTLTGQPQIWDAETRVRADRIVVNLQTRDAEGVGHIRSTQQEAAAPNSSAAPVVPTNVVADRMLARRESQFVHYEGHVHAWHGPNVMESPALDIYKTERKISSTSGVLTSFLQSAPADPKSARPVTIRADRLEYADEGRRGSYRGNVELRTETSTLRADRLDVYFISKTTGAPSELDRAVADGHVKVMQTARTVTAEHAEYFAGAGKILMTGGPPAIYDASEGFTTGRSLTLFLHDDTIFVDGGAKSPTLSKHRLSR
jgi:lipopolysaccharide export system protein LptA